LGFIFLGFPLLLGVWEFFLKLGLKDNLGFVGLIGRGVVIGCFFVWGFQRFPWLHYYLLLCGWFSFFWAFPGFPLLWVLKVVALERG
jgi:hypothetical protein